MSSRPRPAPRRCPPNIAGVSQSANDTGTAASQVLASARELAQQSESLKNVVTKFLVNVKAA